MRIKVVVNAKGRIIISHDEQFEAIPLWVRYYKDNRELELLFNNGRGSTVLFPIDDYMHGCLLKETKVLLVRMEEIVPVESYDTHLIIQ